MRAEVVQEIRRRLKLWRARTMKQKRVTQVEFALKAKLAPSTIKGLLGGPVQSFNPELETLYTFVAACDKTLGDLFDFLITDVEDETRKLIIRARDNPYTSKQLDSLIELVRTTENALTE